MRIILVQNPLVESGDPEIDKPNQERWQHNLDVLTRTMRALGYEVTVHTASPDLEQFVLENDPDLVFLQSFRSDPEDRIFSAMAFFEAQGIPFTGSALEASRLARDKFRAKVRFRERGIPTPGFSMIPADAAAFEKPPDQAYPLFIKPISAGASQGIHADNPVSTDADFERVARETIRATRQPALIEEFVPGREFTVGILGNDPPIALPIREFIEMGSQTEPEKFRSFQGKADKVHKEKSVCPAEIPADLREQISNLAVLAFKALSCRDYGRVDVRLDAQGNPLVLEINVHPSLLPDSSFPKMAAVHELDYGGTIDAIIQSAAPRIR